ncbi:MAG: hypothetical protein RLY35_2119 [Bacteroidota bacterium]
MKTTMNVQLGHYNFPFEMDAFEFLKQYIEQLNRAFSKELSKDEIIEDIESRIGELLNENRKDKVFPVHLGEIQSITQIMGSFEDFTDATDANREETTSAQSESDIRHARRKIYRDQDDAVAGGVCAGLSYYLGWDPVVLRIVMVILLLASFGTFFMAYLIAWAVIPAAKSTSEKLLMRGNEVNLESIQQFVREEANRAEKNARKWGRKVEDHWKESRKSSSLWSGVKWIMGLFLLFFGFGLLFLITIFMAWSDGGEIFLFGSDIQHFTTWIAPDGLGEMMLMGGALIVLAPAISVLYTGIHFLLGLKFKKKWIYLFSTLSLLFGVLVCTYTGIKLAKDFDTEGRITRNVHLNNLKGDTLYLDIAEDPYIIGRGNDEEDVLETVSVEGDQRVLSNSVEVRLMDTDRNDFWFEVIQTARGSNLAEAGNRANQMDFRYSFDNNHLKIDPYFKIPVQIPYRAQSVQVVVHVPSRKQVMLNERWGWVSWKDDWNNQLLINEEGYFHQFY